MEQRTEEWYAARLGKVTASKISKVTAKTKSGGWGAERANYMAALLCERLTGTKMNDYVNAEMQWGTDTEPQAKDAYSFHCDVDVQDVAFVDHPRIAMSGASPDGLIGTDGLVEIKCPNTATHIETLLGGSFPGAYIQQVQWQMACTGRKWCHLVSFDPRLPESMRLHVVRVARDDAVIADLEHHVELFLRELAVKQSALIEKYAKAA